MVRVLGKLRDYLNWAAAILLLFGLFGLRGIAITPLLVRLFGPLGIRPLLPVIYTACLLAGSGLLAADIWQNRRRWKAGFTAVRPYALSAPVWLALSAPFFFLAITRRLTIDFWLDEVMSIYRHIQPSLGSALFWYPAPNNHIFSNAFTNIYIQLVGTRELQTLFDQPIILRGLYFGFSIGAILLTGAFAERVIGRRAGIFATLFLTTSIPFLNFAAQVRGYAPSLLFFTLLLNLLVSYRERQHRRTALGILALAAMLFYTIPSNIYILASAALYSAFFGFQKFFRERERRIQWKMDSFRIVNEELTPAVLIGAGLIVAALFYLPVIQQVIDNKFVTSLGVFRGTVFVDAFPRTMAYFNSGRLLLVAAAAVGIGLVWRQGRQHADPKRSEALRWLLTLCFLPFGLSFVRGDNPFERTFLVGLPVFALLAALGWHALLTGLEQVSSPGKHWRYVFIGLFALAINGIFLWNYRGIEDEIFNNLVTENIDAVEYYDNTLRASHHLDHYQVRQVVETVRPALEAGIPILVDINDTRFAWVVEIYFEAYGIPFTQISTRQTVQTETGYVVVAYANRSLAEFQAVDPDVTCELLPGEVSLFRVMACRFPP